MKKMTLLMMVLALVCMTIPAVATELGDLAPPLTIHQWVKGKKLNLAEGKGKKIYVVEFWATWCPPCRTSIPHLTELQKKYAGKDVVFVGISSEDLDNVKAFVKEMGNEMDYTVAVDEDKKTSNAYMGGFGVDSIPHAFIVDKDMKMVWHGHPMDGMDDVLDRLIKGMFNVETAQKEEAAKSRRTSVKNLIQVYLFLEAKTEDRDLALPIGNRIWEKAKDDAELLNMLALAIVSDDELKPPDLPLAERAVTRANLLTAGKDLSVLETYAIVQYKTGKKLDAIVTMKRIIPLCTDAEAKGEMRERLTQFEQDTK